MLKKKIIWELFLIFLICNFLITAVIFSSHLILVLKPKISKRDYAKELTSFQRVASEKLPDAELTNLLYWTWFPGWIYEPWLGYREKPRTSKYVNVSPEGIRKTANGAKTLKDFRKDSVFFFGGSTTFGYGVTDSETIPSHLQNFLGQKATVFNFGRGYYYSAQENLLFKSLVEAGFVPKLAIFLDGINERCDNEIYQEELAQLFSQSQKYSWGVSNFIFPFLKIIRQLQNKPKIAENSKSIFSFDCEKLGKHYSLREVFITNIEYRNFFCQWKNVQCLTFIQPFAGVNGKHLDLKKLSFGPRYLSFAKYLNLMPAFSTNNVFDISDSLKDLKVHSYVDDVHYSPLANDKIAKEIFNIIPFN